MIRISLAAFVILCAIGIFSYNHIRTAANLLQPISDTHAWIWQQDGDVSGGLKFEQDAVRVDIIKADTEDWRLSLYQETVTLKEGHKYRFAFIGKSSITRTITAVATKGYNPGSNGGMLGMRADFTLDNQWKQQETTFYAKGTNGQHDRVPILYFGAGPPATIWLKDIRLEQID